MKIGVGKSVELWESVWDECGEVNWGVGGGEEKCEFCMCVCALFLYWINLCCRVLQPCFSCYFS